MPSLTKPAVQGIIILSSSLRTIYVSPAVGGLVNALLPESATLTLSQPLPPPLRDVGYDLREAIGSSVSQGQELSYEVSSVLSSPEGVRYFRAAGVADKPSADFMTIMVISDAPVPSFSPHKKLIPKPLHT